MKLNDYLFEKRIENCLSIKEQAKELNMSYLSYFRIEHGKTKILQFTTIRKLASYYNIKPTDIVNMLKEQNEIN